MPNKPIRVYNPNIILSTIFNWIAQNKYDGKRTIIACENDQVILYGRLGQKFKEKRPWLAGLSLPQPWLIDGELLRNGNIYAWDYAILAGRPQYHLPYLERWNLLKDLTPLEESGKRFAIVESRKADAYLELLEPGVPDHSLVEGVVWKSPSATNLWGLSSTSEIGTQIKWRLK